MSNFFKEEYRKCYQDKTRQYFIESYLQTFDASQGREAKFVLFPRQIEFIKSLAYNESTIALKPRQTGITTVSAAWVTGQCVFAKPDSPETVLCIANKLEQAQELLDKIFNFLDQVPRWMWGPDFYSPDPDSEKNLKSIYKKRNRSHYELVNGCKGFARASSAHSARGISAVSCLVMDEAAYLVDSQEAYTSAIAAMSSVDPSKRRVVVVSTPFGHDRLYFNIYSQALAHQNSFNVVEFRWYQDPRYNKFLKWVRKDEETGEEDIIEEETIDSKGSIPYNEAHWKDLVDKGYKPTSPWYVSMCKTMNNNELLIAQELECSFLGSSDNVVNPDVIEYHRTHNVIEITKDWPLKDPLVEDTWIWEDPIPGHRYIVACDPSSGSSDDRTSIQVIDADSVGEDGYPCYRQVLEYNGKRTGDEVGFLVDRYGRAYNNALAVVECIGGYGDATALYLQNNKYPNLYYDDANLKNYTAEDKFNTRYVKNKNKKEELAGFRSNALRIQMLSNFAEMLKDNRFCVRSMRVINELDTWIFKNGRPDHMTGFHDDSLTCLAMGLFVMQYHMFKRANDKSMNEAIIKSWRCSNSSSVNANQDLVKKLPEEIDFTKTQKRQIYSSRAMDRKRSSRLNAMLMLGGYKPKR